MNANTDKEKTIEQLNSFLRGELSAMETYRQALEKVKDPNARSVLSEAHQSHAGRVATLQQKIRAYGGEPSTSSGPWGAFAKLVEGAAKPFGEAAAIAVLEQGEDHGMNDYKEGVSKLDASTQQWFQTEIMRKQRETHAKVSQLKHSLAAQSKM